MLLHLSAVSFFFLVDLLFYFVIYFLIRFAAAVAKSLQSCLFLCDPMDCSLPGSSTHGIFQARALEWVAIAFSLQFLNKVSKQKQ